MQDARRERVLYPLSIHELLSKRELDCQINSSAYECIMLGNAKLPEIMKPYQAYRKEN